MIKFQINLDYRVPKPKTDAEKEAFKSNSELTENYLAYAARKKYPDGMPSGVKLRSFARVQRKIDDAIEEGKDYISLENAEFDVIKEIFKDELAFPADIARFIVVLLDEIDSMTAAEKVSSEKKSADDTDTTKS